MYDFICVCVCGGSQHLIKSKDAEFDNSLNLYIFRLSTFTKLKIYYIIPPPHLNF